MAPLTLKHYGVVGDPARVRDPGDAGIRLGVVVSDLHDLLAQLMVKALIAGKSVTVVRITGDSSALVHRKRSSTCGRLTGAFEKVNKETSGIAVDLLTSCQKDDHS